MKIKLNKMFKMLRAMGYFARQDFWCCQSCGWGAIPKAEAEKAVFYHHQDTPDIKKIGRVHLCWSGNGVEIVMIAESCGLSCKWDGSEGQRIEVINK